MKAEVIKQGKFFHKATKISKPKIVIVAIKRGEIMPCYVVVTVSVSFKVQNKDLFEKTLKAMGFSKLSEMNGVVNVQTENGKTLSFDLINEEVSSKDFTNQLYLTKKLNAIKRGYSEQALEQLAKKKKWLLKQTTESKFQLKRF